MELWSEDRDPKRIKRILEKIENPFILKKMTKLRRYLIIY